MSDINTYADEAAITGLTPINGDLVLNRDNNSLYLCTDSSASGIARWKKFANDSAAVLYQNRWGASFDGSDDYLTTSPVTPNAQQGTISGWIKVPSSHSGHMQVVTWSILSTSNTYQDRLTVRNGQIRYYHQDSTAGIDIVQGATTGLFDNTWHHVAVVCNGSSYALYLDGSPETVSVVLNSYSAKWIVDITG